MTLPIDPITKKQQTTRDMRKGLQKELKDKARVFIVTKVTNTVQRQQLLDLLDLLESDHQVELQMLGAEGERPGNLALIEGAMNNELGWHNFRPVLRTLPPGTVIAQVIIDTSAVEKQRTAKKKLRLTGTARALMDALLAIAVGGEKVSVRSWFKLEP